MEKAMDMKAITDRMGEAIKQYVARALAPILTRLATVETRTGALSMIAGRGVPEEKLATLETLEARVKALEARPVMEYRGVWNAGEDYRHGDFVTWSGSMFYCWTATRGKPGETEDWQLCVKRGKDAR